MADTFSPLLRAILQANAGNVNLWGTIFNSSVIDLLEDSIAGIANIDVTTGNVDLAPQNGLTDDSRPMFLYINGDPGGAVTVKLPTLSKIYIIINATSPAVTVNLKTQLSAAVAITPANSPTMIVVDSVNNLVRSPGRANSISPMTVWVPFTLTIQNRTAGDATLACRYAKQGHFVFFEVPAFNTTTSTGTLTFAETLPAAIRPGTALGSGAAAAEFPTWIDGAAAGVEFCFTAQANGIVLFRNIGTAAVAAPDTYNTVARSCYVWSTRGP